MNELANVQGKSKNHRWQLLATVSAIALIGAACCASEARATDNDGEHSSVWIELGGQLNRLSEGQEGFSPPSMDVRPSIFSPSQKFEGLPLRSVDESGKISFAPQGSNWVFSASVRYGRSNSNAHVHQQTSPATFIPTRYGHPTAVFDPVIPLASRFADTSVQNRESHAIIDFQAGRDFGLGMFGGREGSSVLNFGIRFAQFNIGSNIAIASDPDWHLHYKYVAGFHLADGQPFHSNRASLEAARSFHGIGPSISWDASVPILGNSQGELALDWGFNAAALFGRQRARVAHHEIGYYHTPMGGNTGDHITVYQPAPVDIERTKFVTVPNVGGFAGASWRIQNFKVSAGYRADFFWGAMDGGIDVARKENVGFYGPFATISVGIGG